MSQESLPKFKHTSNSFENTSVLKNIDFLTGLQGEEAFREKLSKITESTKEWGIMIFDVDDFKYINDIYSYSLADHVLVSFVQALQKIYPKTIKLYRLTGDTFAILVPKATQKIMLKWYEKAQECAQTPIQFAGISISFSISAGIVLYPEHESIADLLYRDVWHALLASKENDKHCYTVFSESLVTHHESPFLVLEKLRDSVERDCSDFKLFFQPIMDAKSKELYGCEALLRWEHPYFYDQLILTEEFIPILENDSLICKVGYWIVETAFAQCAKWQKIMPSFHMNVNVSPIQIEDNKFIPYVLEALGRYSLDPSTITFELTESSKIDTQRVRHCFDFLRSQGFKTAFDDFGTGYSSLDIFRTIRGDILKIDKSFVEHLAYDIIDQTLVRSIIDICKTINMSVCVEGIEDICLETLVSEMEPDFLQGYFYSHPISAEDFESKFLTHLLLTNENDHSCPITPNMHLNSAYPISLRNIINEADAGIFQVALDKHFTFLTCNEGFRRMVSYTSKEIKEDFENSFLRLIYPGDEERVQKEIRSQLDISDYISLEFRIKHAGSFNLSQRYRTIVEGNNSDYLWVRGAGSVVHTTSGSLSLILVLINCSDKKNEEVISQTKHDRYKSMINLLPTGIIRTKIDSDISIDYISTGFLDILGYTYHELQDKFEGKYINLLYDADNELIIKEFNDNLVKSEIFSLSHKMNSKNGDPIWLETLIRVPPVNTGETRYAYWLITHVSQVEEHSGLNISNVIAATVKHSHESLFEYYFSTEVFLFSDAHEAKFGHRKIIAGAEDAMLAVHPDDYSKCKNLGETIPKVQTQISSILRIINAEGNYIYCQVLINPPLYVDGKIFSLTGTIFDIDIAYRKSESLKKEIKIDPLTRLLNRTALREQITALVENFPEKHYALFMIDIDDFKRINTKYGYVSGDEALHKIANRLYKTFRKTDIVGRSGGDEFMVLMEFNGDIKNILNHCEILQKLMREPIELQNGTSFSVKFSFSVVCSPSRGNTFGDIFSRAKKALLKIKDQGKNNFLIIE